MTEAKQEYMPYEGAGFLMYYEDNFVLGTRIKKPEDLVKDPILEIEYMGGKIDPEDNNDPLKTAYNELVEEIGVDILEKDWNTRITPIQTFQSISKKYIWCCLLKLSKKEYSNLVAADLAHDKWLVAEKRDLKNITGRSELVRKAISAFVIVDKQELVNYISNFSKVPVSDNRMADAKKYRNNSQIMLKATRISNPISQVDFH